VARANALLSYAKKLLERGEGDMARERLQEIVKGYPDTEAAKEAKKLLGEVGK
jgi:TolA-binding protein